MPIWATAPVSEEPSIRLSDWQIVEVDDGTRHFVGYNLCLHEGRVSSAIVRFDPDTRTGVTRSGRVYRLEGALGEDQDALWTWTGWCRVNGVKRATVVTELALEGK